MNSLLLALTLSCSVKPTPQPLPQIWSPTMDLQGHRGARGHHPENSEKAFLFAIEAGMTTIELDTILTADGYLAVHHDSNTNPMLCTNITGGEIERHPIRERTLADLKKLNCGVKIHPKFPMQIPSKEEILSLEEFFERITDNSIRFNIELKFPSDPSRTDIETTVSRALTVIEKAGMVHRSNIQSFLLEGH